GGMRKIWRGELFGIDPGFSANRQIQFQTPGAFDTLNIQLAVAATRIGSHNFNVSLNGQNLATLHTAYSNELSFAYDDAFLNSSLPFNQNNANFELQFNPGTSASRGYLDFIQLNYRRALSFYNSQMNFRDLNSVSPNQIAQYKINNANQNLKVWDITDPLSPILMNGQLNGTVYQFNQVAGTLREFIAFDGSQYFSPTIVGQIANQNLHAQGTTDYIIITPREFEPAANKLAQFHREANSLKVQVGLTEEIYNEFGSGSKDAGAIRDYV